MPEREMVIPGNLRKNVLKSTQVLSGKKIIP
jgi:hypothetical protein